VDLLLHLLQKKTTYFIPFCDPSTNTTIWLVSLRRHGDRMLSCSFLYHEILGFEESGTASNV
jgi:hypothetical protein